MTTTKNPFSASAEPTSLALYRKSNLGEVAYERITEWLIGGQFRVGAKLTVRSVADALDISTTPARDAINRLISEGALANLGAKTVVLPRLTLRAIDEVSKIRLSLEGLAAFEATEHIKVGDIDDLECIQASQDEAIAQENYMAALKFNREFHFLVYRRSNMPHLVQIISSQWLRIGPSLNDVYPIYKPRQGKYSNHRWIIEVLRNKDAHAVRAGFQSDIRDGQRTLSYLIQAQEY